VTDLYAALSLFKIPLETRELISYTLALGKDLTYFEIKNTSPIAMKCYQHYLELTKPLKVYYNPLEIVTANLLSFGTLNKEI
jgi:hypothetical protein